MTEHVYIDTDSSGEELITESQMVHSIPNEVTLKDYQNAYLLPYQAGDLGGVLTENKEFVYNSSLHEGMGGGYSFSQEEVMKSNDRAIYMGMLFPIWGHCLTDNIKKLWFLQTQEGKSLLQSGCKLVYVVMIPQQYPSLPKNYIELLSFLGIDKEQITCVTEITQYKTVYIPDDAFVTQGGRRLFTPIFSTIKDSILENIPEVKIKTYEKIYFSRAKFSDKKKADYGEKRIESVFRYLGYKILYPEKLSLAEQITLLQHCNYFATTEGSISHNALFCKRGTHICLIRKVNFVNPYQQMINEMCDLQVTYVDAHLSIFTKPEMKWNGPFFLYVNNNVCDFANLPYVFNNFSISDFGKYVRDTLPKIDQETLVLSEFYTKRLIYEMNRSNFCKGFLKRILQYLFSHLPIGLLVWVCKVAQIRLKV